MCAFKILHVLPDSDALAVSEALGTKEWAVELFRSNEIAEKLKETVYDLIVDSGASDLLLSVFEGTEKQSNRFLEGVHTSAKLLVNLGDIEVGENKELLDQEIWDQLGKQLAWRFCALDRPIWVRFVQGELGQKESILLESLKHWTGPGLNVIRANDLETAARIALEG